MDTTISAQIANFSTLLQEWDASYEEYARRVGLSYTSLQVLSTIRRMEKCTQKDICARCFLPKQTVNSVITKFLKCGWIELKENPADRRSKWIHFTEEGRQKADAITNPIREAERAGMNGLSASQREELLETFKLYVRACQNTLNP